MLLTVITTVLLGSPFPGGLYVSGVTHFLHVEALLTYEDATQRPGRPGPPGLPAHPRWESLLGADAGPNPAGAPLTSVLIEEAADTGQDGQSDEVSQAGSNGRGNVVGVDPKLPSANHDADHQHSCGEETEETHGTG